MTTDLMKLLEIIALLEELEEEVEAMETALVLEREHIKFLSRKVEEQKAYIEALEKGMELHEKTIKNLERRSKKNGVSEIFTQEDIRKILEMYHFWEYSQEEIAQKFGTSQQRISEAVNRKVTKGKDAI